MPTQVYSIDEIREIVAPIAKQHGVDKVFLFGSYARGDATPASDVDLCVDAPKLRGLFALGGLYADLEDALKKSIDHFPPCCVAIYGNTFIHKNGMNCR